MATTTYSQYPSISPWLTGWNTMKNDKLKHVSLFILLLILFSTSAAAFTLLDDISPSFGISSGDADDDFSHADETPHAEVPTPFCLHLRPLQAMVLSQPSVGISAVRIIPFLNHISRAPPLYFS
jgi:hypothetical protein